MPWLDRPAGVYTRFEVVLHRIDDPHVLHLQNPVSGMMTAYEVWEIRAVFVFDAQGARWEVATVKPFGYRKGQRNAPRVEIQGTSPELRALVARYAPDWIPDPSKAKTWLPAEDVWDEVADAIAEKSQASSRWIRAENPYRGE